MELEILLSVTKLNCKHEKHRKYTQRSFDIINGFEMNATKCLNCHKSLELTIRGMSARAE